LFNLGIDLDNTIIDYSNSILNLAKTEYGISLENNDNLKKEFKNFIISEFNENEWTRVQGLLYTDYINFANVYDGFLINLENLKFIFDNVYIISHKTEFPYIGSRIDLRSKATNWIMQKIVSNSGRPFFKETEVFFESSLMSKIRRISEQQCKVFIDDLPEVLTHLPSSSERILIGSQTRNTEFKNYENWFQIARYLSDKYK
jgi:hypothetical protein